MTHTQSHVVDSNGVRLAMRLLGNPKAPAVVMLHGLQDVGASLLPVATRLAEHFRVVLPDLRGHGASDRPGAYAMPAFVYDLHAICDDLQLEHSLLFGHSLGGQVLARFAALYPERARAMVLVEGLGPPRVPGQDIPGASLVRESREILRTLGARPRALPDLDIAAARLGRNNPRLPPARARELVRHLIESTPDGDLRWAFDPRVPSLFVAPEDAPRYWPHVRCPTLIAAGAHAGEFWRWLFPDADGWHGGFAPGELEARAALFACHELRVLEGSGHMVHFDEPQRLAEFAAEFLLRHA